MKLPKWLMFDNIPNDNYELLETEYGEPYQATSSQSGENAFCGVPKDTKLYLELDKNIEDIKAAFRSDISKDLVVREFNLCKTYRAAIFFINGMVDSDIINNFLLRDGIRGCIPQGVENPCDYAIKNVFTANDITMTDSLEDIQKGILDGLTAVIIDSCGFGCTVDTRRFPERSVEKAENEKDILGPGEAFIENIRTNITLIRRHVHTKDLVCELRQMGEDSKTSMGILYREGVADRSLVIEVKKRLANVKLRSCISTGIFSQIIENEPFSPVPQILLTERPDRCASHLLEGHIVLLCDGSPMGAILPVTLYSLMSVPEDIYGRQAVGNLMRIVRYIGALLSITIPGIFIAIAMYHQGFLSSEMLSTLISSRRMVFIPIGVELLLLLFVFQMIREAGMRVPGNIGQAIGIIGGLVLGQAIVSANLASSVVLIFVALTGLGSFAIPDYSTQLGSTVFRLLFVALGWLAGFMGLTCGMLIFVGYLSTLKSFGVPFLTPYAPKTNSKRLAVLRGRINNGKLKKEDYMQ